MKPVLSAEQISEWDAFTISNEPISSYDLMERAAGKCVEDIRNIINLDQRIAVFCGPGNNGGDGLVIARHLLKWGFDVKVFLLKFAPLSPDADKNLSLLPNDKVTVLEPEKGTEIIKKFDVYIDALFGTGLSRSISEPLDKWVFAINNESGSIISVDMPSGVFADEEDQPECTIKADFTLTFQAWKKSMIYAKNQSIFGKISLLDIGLHPDFTPLKESKFLVSDKKNSPVNITPQNEGAHKYERGYLFIHAGSENMKGAPVLVAKGAQSVGTGLIEVTVQKGDFFPIPEVITSFVQDALNINDKVSAVVCGPGLGKKQKQHILDLQEFDHCPVVFDADALNYISVIPGFKYPKSCVITPHEGELQRLLGNWKTRSEMFKRAQSYAEKNDIIVIAKGPLTKIITPEKIYTNTNGNALLATAGSGDFLSGILGGLLAQSQYTLEEAALLAVFLHGRSADLFKEKNPGKMMVASDISEYLLMNEISEVSKSY